MKTKQILYQYLSNNNVWVSDMSIDKFITNHNPPCKECLVQNMCIVQYKAIVEATEKPWKWDIEIDVCDRLKTYLKNNNPFYELRFNNETL